MASSSSSPPAEIQDASPTFHPSLGQPGFEVVYHPSPLLPHSYSQPQPQSNSSTASFTVSIPPASLPHIFAHRQWRAGMILSDLLYTHPSLVHSKYVLELGCGTALPSFLSAYQGAEMVLTTDYDEESVVRVLKENVGRAVKEVLRGGGKVRGVGYTWGHSPDDLFDYLPNGVDSFDVVLLADTLWDPLSHSDLAKSLSTTLSRKEDARVIVVAGLHTGRERIMDFVKKARRVGLDVVRPSETMGLLWDESEMVDEPALEEVLARRSTDDVQADEWTSHILECELAPDDQGEEESSSPHNTAGPNIIHSRGPRLTGRRRKFVAYESLRPEEAKERGGIHLRNRWMTIWSLGWRVQ
ncbi:hypothetical protein A4X13_0g7515 [Tilletia indica]|uniref:Uncharacterized protein n=1 Tax=Tilletia indica TaxID=43049 RepID=A0A177TCC6_9BASI|nr:hypothetical protein A4X13_0g7515 [Tilletia indica]